MEGNSEMAGKDLFIKLVDEIVIILSYNNLVKYIFIGVVLCIWVFFYNENLKKNKVKQKKVHSSFIVIFNVITL